MKTLDQFFRANQIASHKQQPAKQITYKSGVNVGLVKNLREKEDYTGVLPITECTLWRWVKSGYFPKPIKLSARCTVWRASDVYRWIEEQEIAKTTTASEVEK